MRRVLFTAHMSTKYNDQDGWVPETSIFGARPEIIDEIRSSLLETSVKKASGADKVRFEMPKTCLDLKADVVAEL